MSRVRRHVLFALVGCGIAGVVAASVHARGAAFQLSMGTAYAALLYLAAVLSLGPIYALKQRRRPASTYLRRDLAIWSAVFAIIHVFAGLQVHFTGRMWAYFFSADASGLTARLDLFGLTNYAGAAATAAFAVLLFISNDASMRALGVERWRSIQSCAPWIGVLTVAHAWIYQALEHRSPTFVVASLIIVFAVVALRGFRPKVASSR